MKVNDFVCIFKALTRNLQKMRNNLFKNSSHLFGNKILLQLIYIGCLTSLAIFRFFDFLFLKNNLKKDRNNHKKDGNNHKMVFAKNMDILADLVKK